MPDDLPVTVISTLSQRTAVEGSKLVMRLAQVPVQATASANIIGAEELCDDPPSQLTIRRLRRMVQSLLWERVAQGKCVIVERLRLVH